MNANGSCGPISSSACSHDCALRIAFPDLGDRQVRHRIAIAVADELGEPVARSADQSHEVVVRLGREPDVAREGRDAHELGRERRDRREVLGERG